MHRYRIRYQSGTDGDRFLLLDGNLLEILEFLFEVDVELATGIYKIKYIGNKWCHYFLIDGEHIEYYWGLNLLGVPQYPEEPADTHIKVRFLG